MSVEKKIYRVIMIDSLVGNDYSVCLCSALNKVGVNIELITPVNRVINLPVDYEIKYWITTKDLKKNKISKIAHYLAYLARVFFYVIRNNEFKQIVHFQFFRREWVESVLFLLLKLFGVNLVFTAHNVLPHEFTKLDFLPRQIIYRSSKFIIVHSEFIKNKITQTFRINPDKIWVIPHGNFDHYVPVKPISKAEARSQLDLELEDKVILFFGFIRKYKGLDLLLNAFEISIEKNKQLKLVIAGAAPTTELANFYKNKVTQIAKDGSIIYHPGFVPFDEVAKYFNAADIVVLPYSDIDHSGIVHLAYSFGKPLITTNVGDFPEILENGKSGYILKDNNVRCLSEVILKSFTNGSNLMDMGICARNLSETKYSWAEIAKKTRELYDSC